MKALNLRIELIVPTLLIALCMHAQAFGQTWTHDFETAGGYTTSNTECTDNADDYFTRTDGSDVNDDPTGIQGLYYFAAQDIDAAGCPAIPSANGTMIFNDVSIAGCTGLSFEMYAAAFNSGWDDVDFVHIYYDIDNSGTWTNLIWFENNGATFNSAPMVDANFDGTGDGTTLSSTFQNIIAPIAGTGTVIDIQIEFQLDAGSEDICIDNLRIYGTGCGGGGGTTITTGAVNTAPFSIECSTPLTASGTVNFTSTGTFTAGNVYTAQLSDAIGSFASPTTIGTLSSTANSGSISFTLPANLITGSGYMIRVISDSPSTTGSNSAMFTILQNSPCPVSLPANGLVINEW